MIQTVHYPRLASDEISYIVKTELEMGGYKKFPPGNTTGRMGKQIVKMLTAPSLAKHPRRRAALISLVLPPRTAARAGITLPIPPSGRHSTSPPRIHR